MSEFSFEQMRGLALLYNNKSLNECLDEIERLRANKQGLVALAQELLTCCTEPGMNKEYSEMLDKLKV